MGAYLGLSGIEREVGWGGVGWEWGLIRGWVPINFFCL